MQASLDLRLLAVTVNEQDGEHFLENVKRFILGYDRIKVAVGVIETGKTGVRHWQLTLKSSVGHQSIRNALKDEFPSLKGVSGVSDANKLSVAPARKTFEKLVGYCLKTIPIGSLSDSSTILMKGISYPEVEKIPRFAEDVAVGEGKNLIDKISNYVDKTIGYDRTRKAMGREILNWHINNRKLLPSKWRLRDYIDTVQVRLSDDYDQSKFVEDLVGDALNL